MGRIREERQGIDGTDGEWILGGVCTIGFRGIASPLARGERNFTSED